MLTKYCGRRVGYDSFSVDNFLDASPYLLRLTNSHCSLKCIFMFFEVLFIESSVKTLYLMVLSKHVINQSIFSVILVGRDTSCTKALKLGSQLNFGSLASIL